MGDRIASESFLRELQRVLWHLYDPSELQRSPLISLLALERHLNPAAALQRVVIDAIQALKPGRTVPLNSMAWRVYHILTYCYVEQSSQKTVADTLALSVRQLRRLQRVAEQTLADYLWERYAIRDRMATSTTLTTPERQQELEWLKESFPSQTAAAADEIYTVLKTVAPLAQASCVEIGCELAEDLPAVSGQLVLLRQALLNVLTAAVRLATSGQVRLTATYDLPMLCIEVTAVRSRVSEQASYSEIAETVHMARQCMALFGGSVEIFFPQDQDKALIARLTVPIAERLPVLVVDDNADTLRLFQRYFAGTRFQFIGTVDANQAVALAEAHSPRAIVMDIMLPGVDGWELLGRLRTHPKIRDVPIVVCTILPQEQLALTLGAAAFLRKPVTREMLLKTLEQQLDSAALRSFEAR